MVFREHRIPKPPAPPVRPAWMNTDVIDPDWLKAHPTAKGTAIPDPFTVLDNESARQLDLLFAKDLFKKDNTKLSDKALDLLEAITDLMDMVGETYAPEQTTVKIMDSLAPELQTLVRKIRGLVLEALSTADDEINRADFIRGIWEHYIIAGAVESDLMADELAAGALELAVDRTEVERVFAEALKGRL